MVCLVYRNLIQMSFHAWIYKHLFVGGDDLISTTSLINTELRTKNNVDIHT